MDSSWKIYNSANSPLGNESIRDIEIDEAGNKWIGSIYKLFKLHSDDSTWTVFDKQAEGLAIDKFNNKWIMSNTFPTSPGKARIYLEKFDDINWTFFEDEVEYEPYFSNKYICDR